MNKPQSNNRYLIARDFYSQLEGKIALIKSDFNVPIHNGKISDSFKIEKSAPFIIDLINNKTIPLIATHLGRLKGYDENLKLDVLIDPINKLIGKKVNKEVEIIRFNPISKTYFENQLNRDNIIQLYKSNKIPILDNIRFHPSEENNQGDLAKKLSGIVDISIQNSFGTAHRKEDTSNYIHKLIPGFAGDLLVDEIEEHIKIKIPNSPYTVIVGGDKVIDSLNLIRRILWSEKTTHPLNSINPDLMDHIGEKLVDKVLIGGNLMNAFIYAQLEMASDKTLEKIHPMAARNLRGLKDQRFLQRCNPNKKELEEEIRLAKGLLRLYNNYQFVNQFKNTNDKFNTKDIVENRRLLIPIDYKVIRNGKERNLSLYNLHADDTICDIGKNSIKIYGNIINSSKTIVWNGSMGTDDEVNVSGTHRIIDHINNNQMAVKTMGGGSSNKIAQEYDSLLGDVLNIGFRSTGGGSTLQEISQDSTVTTCLKMSYTKLLSAKYGQKYENFKNSALIKYSLSR